jgi:hypothetical protein
VIVYGPSEPPCYNYFVKCLSCRFELPPSDHILRTGTTVLHSDTMMYDREYVVSHMREISVL